MADYFVASGGSNTSPYDTWAKAATSLATALAAATASGDRVIIQYDGVPSTDSALAADTTYTAANHIAIISSTNSGTATVTPTVMGTDNWIGNSTTNRSISISGAYKIYIYGLTFRTAGSTADYISIMSPSGEINIESCYFWCGNTGANVRVTLGNANSASSKSYFRAKNCVFRFAHSSQGISLQGKGEIIGGSISADGVAITTIFTQTGWYTNNPRHVYGFDMSAAASTAYLTAASTSDAFDLRLYGCKLPSAFVLYNRTGGLENRSSGDVTLFNCASADTHYHFAHADMMGETVMSTGIYANDGASYDGTNRLSWKIVTTAYCSYYAPYVSPWIDRYHAGTSAITPYLEIVRSGSSTAYNDDEVWSEWSYQGTSGYPLSTIVSDRMALAGTPAAQTSSSKTGSDWTGEDATSWFGKLSPTASITPAEIGHLRARVCVGAASTTVYVDPTIRGTT